jgi:hypothetical protein
MGYWRPSETAGSLSNLVEASSPSPQNVMDAPGIAALVRLLEVEIAPGGASGVEESLRYAHMSRRGNLLSMSC